VPFALSAFFVNFCEALLATHVDSYMHRPSAQRCQCYLRFATPLVGLPFTGAVVSSLGDHNHAQSPVTTVAEGRFIDSLRSAAQDDFHHTARSIFTSSVAGQTNPPGIIAVWSTSCTTRNIVTCLRRHICTCQHRAWRPVGKHTERRPVCNTV